MSVSNFCQVYNREKFALKDGQLARIEKFVAQLGDVENRAFDLTAAIQAERLFIVAALERVRHPGPPNFQKPTPQSTTGIAQSARTVGRTDRAHESAPRIAKPEAAHRPAASPSELTGPEQRIVDAIAWMESIGVAEPEQTAVAFLAGYTIGGGGFNNPRGALRTKGLIEYRSDRLALTDAGRFVARYPDGALTSEELQRRVLARLPGPEQKILRVLLEAYPSAVDNDDLARASGYEPGGGGFNNPRGRLRTLGLVEYPERGKVIARSILFLEAR